MSGVQHFRLAVNDDIDFVYPTLKYAPALYKVINQNRDHLKTFLPWAETMTSVEKEAAFIATNFKLSSRGESAIFLDL